MQQAFDLADRSNAALRIVCPFAQNYLGEHPELKEKNEAVHSATFVEGSKSAAEEQH